MHVVVVGGGISGLTAARALAADPDTRVTVLESTARLGGKLLASPFAGYDVDEGAEQVLVRRPEALDLIRAVGLTSVVVHPRTSAAAVWYRRRLRPLPDGTVLGVPSSLRALASSRAVTRRGLARAALDNLLPGGAFTSDVTVGSYVRSRLGREVNDRLVDPLLGGVYAGRSDELSMRATMPQLAAAARHSRTAMGAAREVRRASDTAARAPVFATLRGGLGRLADHVLAGADVEVRTHATVRELRRTPDGFRVVIGDTRNPEAVLADGVVLALPAAPAARLLGGDLGSAAAEVAAIDYASVAIVTLAYPRSALPAFGISGFLVPAVENRQVKAVTLSSSKWTHLDGELAIVRCSIGRYGEARDLQRSDDELVAAAVHDLATLARAHGAPVESRVSRWGGGLPQYLPGHLDRVARIRAALPPGLVVCGASYDGVGIPACIASAEEAARGLTAGLRQSTRGREGEAEEEEGA